MRGFWDNLETSFNNWGSLETQGQFGVSQDAITQGAPYIVAQQNALLAAPGNAIGSILPDPTKMLLILAGVGIILFSLVDD